MIIIPALTTSTAPDWWTDLPPHVREDVVAYLAAAGRTVTWPTT